MNYAEARALSDGSGWHFTVRNDDQIWTHHCCRNDGPPASEQDVAQYGYRLGEPTLGTPHEPHATKEQAEDCLHAWRRRQAADWKTTTYGDWTGCSVCDAPTKQGARFPDIGGPTDVALCEQHLTAESLRAYVDAHRVTSAMYS